MENISDINIKSSEILQSPNELSNLIQITEKEKKFVYNSRKIVENIINGTDKRKIFIIGPCSIHDSRVALDYAYYLKSLINKFPNIFFIMRVYFEKPRTSVGWKGYIYDPHLNDTNNIRDGLVLSRTLLKNITALEIPIATEFLDAIIPQYLSEYVTWVAIGARTTESQVHRQLASGLSMPVGFKNGTLGNTDIMVNALKACYNSHCFLGTDKNGNICRIETSGNKNCHSILRGGKNGPNYSIENVSKLTKELLDNNVSDKIIIDASHGNSNKKCTDQIKVLMESRKTIKEYPNVIGFMIESNIEEGNQPLTTPLKYGVSITDECLSIKQTDKLINEFYNSCLNI